MAKDNHFIGNFAITGMSSGSHEIQELEVTFDVDEDGNLDVSASIKIRKKMTLTEESGRLSEDDINRSVKDAEKYNDDDQKEKERSASLNKLEGYCFTTKRAVVEEYKNIVSGNKTLKHFLLFCLVRNSTLIDFFNFWTA